jgi:dTDP-glucose pyrophosphorylase
MTLNVIYLDGGPALDSSKNDEISAKRIEIMTASLLAPVGEKNFLVTNSKQEELEIRNILPRDSTTKVFNITRPTKGALATALLPIDLIKSDEPVVLIPTNSIVQAGELRKFIKQMIADRVSAGALLIKSNNPEYSYARIHDNRVIEFIEKTVVGNMATTGVFYFKDKALLLQSAKWAFVNSQILNSQFFVAPSLNYILTSGQEVGFSIVDEDKYEHL